jgi:hypothetical protein
MADEPEGLQFDRTERASEAAGVAQCGYCNQPLDGTYYQINGRAACERCHAQLQESLQKGSPFTRFTIATVFGAGAALAGSLLWYTVRALTGYEIGLIAVAVGFMVGFAVRKGSNNRGGPLYQALAIVLTYVGICAQYVPDLLKALRDQADAPTGAALVIAFVVVCVLSLAAPFLAGLQNVIGILIIGFALYEAWKLNRRIPLAITGPFRVEAAVPPAPLP